MWLTNNLELWIIEFWNLEDKMMFYTHIILELKTSRLQAKQEEN